MRVLTNSRVLARSMRDLIGAGFSPAAYSKPSTLDFTTQYDLEGQLGLPYISDHATRDES